MTEVYILVRVLTRRGLGDTRVTTGPCKSSYRHRVSEGSAGIPCHEHTGGRGSGDVSEWDTVLCFWRWVDQQRGDRNTNIVGASEDVGRDPVPPHHRCSEHHPPPGVCTHVPVEPTASRLHPGRGLSCGPHTLRRRPGEHGLVKRAVAVFHPENLAILNVLFS